MKKSILITLVIALLSSAAVHAENNDLEFLRKSYKQNRSGVLTLTDEDFDNAIRDFPKLFIKFYTSWCPHCKKLNPKWNQLSREYRKKDKSIIFAQVNAEKSYKVAKE